MSEGGMAQAPELSAGAVDLLSRWLDALRGAKAAADHTISAYRRDVSAYLGFLTLHFGEPVGAATLGRLTPRDVRSWQAHLR
ncbi:MAG: site-specific integrase, partial [Pseudomonadota bacterium]